MDFVGNEDFAFGPFSLSVRHRTLADRDGSISLKSRAFDVLLALIEGSGAVVSKDELMHRVWGGFVVEENNLHVQVAAIRRALGSDHRYILTIPGRGYRFTGVVRDMGGQKDRERLEASTTNLPGRKTALVGRGDELAAIAEMLERGRLVTLVGPSGIGKTNLAIEAARGLRAQFPAGCWWAALGSVTDAGLAVRAVAASLRTDETPGVPLIDGLADLLGRGDVLLVLDGCERVTAAIAALACVLLRRCPRLRLLCTCHTPLGVDGEVACRIAPVNPTARPQRSGSARSFAPPAGDDEATGGARHLGAGPAWLSTQVLTAVPAPAPSAGQSAEL